MQEWIEETNSFTLNNNNEYLGVCYTLMVGSSSMLPGGEHHHAVAYRLLLCPYSSLYLDASDYYDGCMNG